MSDEKQVLASQLIKYAREGDEENLKDALAASVDVDLVPQSELTCQG